MQQPSSTPDFIFTHTRAVDTSQTVKVLDRMYVPRPRTGTWSPPVISLILFPCTSFCRAGGCLLSPQNENALTQFERHAPRITLSLEVTLDRPPCCHLPYLLRRTNVRTHKNKKHLAKKQNKTKTSRQFTNPNITLRFSRSCLPFPRHLVIS